jgi:hypothetical protein
MLCFVCIFLFTFLFQKDSVWKLLSEVLLFMWIEDLFVLDLEHYIASRSGQKYNITYFCMIITFELSL